MYNDLRIAVFLLALLVIIEAYNSYQLFMLLHTLFPR